jgi:hypothetical protein
MIKLWIQNRLAGKWLRYAGFLCVLRFWDDYCPIFPLELPIFFIIEIFLRFY